MGRKAMLGAAAAMLISGGAAMAQDRTGYEAIAAGDFSRAARVLEAERRIFPQRPELMLNLAAVYRQTGRAAEARALYAAVLERPEVTMDLPSGVTRSSHALASAGLSRLTVTAAR